MSERPTEISGDGDVLISPRGALDMVSGPVLRDELHAHIQSGSSRLVVDLSGVELIDSAGLSALISGLKAARQAGGSLRIAHPSKQVRHLLKLTNLDRVLGPYDSEGGTPHGST